MLRKKISSAANRASPHRVCRKYFTVGASFIRWTTLEQNCTLVHLRFVQLQRSTSKHLYEVSDNVSPGLYSVQRDTSIFHIGRMGYAAWTAHFDLLWYSTFMPMLESVVKQSDVLSTMHLHSFMPLICKLLRIF